MGGTVSAHRPAGRDIRHIRACSAASGRHFSEPRAALERAGALILLGRFPGLRSRAVDTALYWPGWWIRDKPRGGPGRTGVARAAEALRRNLYLDARDRGR